MKYANIVGAFLIVSSAFIQDAKSFDHAMCPRLGEIAKNAMKKRQENVLMSDLIIAIEKALGKDGPMTEFGKALVIYAYKTPLYVTDESKQMEINKFANMMLAICYEN